METTTHYEPTLEDRLASLEKQLADVTSQRDAYERRLREIVGEDVPCLFEASKRVDGSGDAWGWPGACGYFSGIAQSMQRGAAVTLEVWGGAK